MVDLKIKYAMLIDSLYRKTIANDIEWQITYLGNLEADIKNYTIRLSEYRDEEGEPFEKVELLSSNGSLIDEFSDALFKGQVPPDADIATYYMKMKYLREQARRKAMGLDVIIDEILSDLDDDIPF